MALRYDLYAALAGADRRGAHLDVARGQRGGPSQEWAQSNATSIARTRNAIGEFDESRADLAALSVLLRQIRTLVRLSS